MKLTRNFLRLALIVSSAVAQLASAATLSAPGILVNGDGSQHFRKCSTCPDEPVLDSDEKGGNNVGSAETTGNATNSFSWLASGTLVGPNALPVLKARAEAQNPSKRTPPSVSARYPPSPPREGCRSTITQEPRLAPIPLPSA